MAKPRRSKSLEKVARSIKDSDEFVNHVFGIAARYRAQYELESGAKGPAVRHALKAFQRHADALETWLQTAQKSATAEHEALAALSAALHGSSSSARASATATQLWLNATKPAVERALLSLKRKAAGVVPHAAVEALRATFEYHGIKLTQRNATAQPNDAVRLLCAVAKDSGDELDAKQASLAFRPPRSAPSQQATPTPKQQRRKR